MRVVVVSPEEADSMRPAGFYVYEGSTRLRGPFPSRALALAEIDSIESERQLPPPVQGYQPAPRGMKR